MHRQLVGLILRVAQLENALGLLCGDVDGDRPGAVLSLHHQHRLHGAADNLLDDAVADRVEAVYVIVRIV